MRLHLRHPHDNLFRPGRVTETPTCHRVSFGHAVDGYSLLFDFLSQRCEASEVETIVNEFLVDFIRDDNDTFVDYYLGDFEKLVFCIGSACRIAGIIKEQGLCRWRNCGRKLFGGDAESVFFFGLYDNRNTFASSTIGRIAYPVWRRDDSLIAFVKEGNTEIIETVFGTRRYYDFIRFVIDTVFLLSLRQIAFLSGMMPLLAVYFVKFWSIAFLPA